MSNEADAIPSEDPFGLFAEWFELAKKKEPNDPEAVALATATPSAAPSVRMVLMKGHGPDGFLFYTNAESRKGCELVANPQAAMLFHWKSLRRQIRIEGAIEQVSDDLADAYFHSRARDSQIGALASDQSRPLPSRATFLGRIAKVGAKYLGREIPRPPHWTGFRLVPHAMEFWMDRAFRLHERRRFEHDAATGAWTSGLLYP
ncbi:pyridoxamine 5'-phosphate oxidase [Novosphingobium sp. MW5]|nr:pyridoxamine 5'-phosphate oxidase [Novosphingobium sp. MW5]